MRVWMRGMGVCALGIALALPAHAVDVQVQAGRSAMGSGHAWTDTLFIEGVWEARPIGDSNWSWSSDASVGWIEGRDLSHYALDHPNTRDDVFLGALGARVHYGQAGDWYRHLFLSFQPALHTGRTQALSSAYEFVTTVGWEGKRWNLQVRHISNAGFQEPNRGETMALVGVNFSL